MADNRHKSGNPDLIKQHKEIQHEGDEDLADTSQQEPKSQSRSKGETEREKEKRDSDNSGSGSNGGSFVGP